MGEFQRIERLAAILRERGAAPEPARIPLGIGDDAALLAPGEARLAASVDAQQQGVHFEPAWLSWEDVGFRALAAAASDLPALGAEPLAALVSATLPLGFAEADFEALARGIAEASAALRLPVVGGNLSRGPSVALHTTALGTVPEAAPLPRRDGARAGDTLLLLGQVGAAAVGLRALRLGRGEEPLLRPFAARWRRPAVSMAAAAVARRAHAAIDLSDGLLADLGRLCEASGLQAVVHPAALPTLAEHEAACAALGLDPLETALRGGEDYALLLAWPADEPPPEGAAAIGALRAPRHDGGPRLWLRGEDGGERAAPKGGWDHFD